MYTRAPARSALIVPSLQSLETRLVEIPNCCAAILTVRYFIL